MSTEKNNPGGAPIVSCDLDEACTTVACATCLVEIPPDLAMSFEGPDYVQHFCGLDCLATWKIKHEKNK